MQEEWREFVELKFNFLLPHLEETPVTFSFGNSRFSC